jgi:hypothetical protein
MRTGSSERINPCAPELRPLVLIKPENLRPRVCPIFGRTFARSSAEHAAMPDWLTWADAGARFGLTPDALRMRARRLGWRTQPGNDGRTLVLVPDDVELQSRSPERTDERLAARSGEQEPEISALREALAVLREAREGEIAALRATADHTLVQLADAQAGRDRAEQRANEAEQRRDQAIARADAADARADRVEIRAERAEQSLAGERIRADVLRERLETAERGQREAVEAAEELRRAEDARRAQGLLARLLAAWQGR